MPILNENLDWATFAANPDLANAFRGTPAKVLLPVSTCLCRFVTTESEKEGIPGTNILSGAWWSDWDTTWSMIARFSAMKIRPQAVVRGRLAVTKGMSQQLDSMVQIILTQPVYAWKGEARYQNDDTDKVTYMGGGIQLFLPNLDRDNKGVATSGRYSEVAYIHCFTSVDSLIDF